MKIIDLLNKIANGEKVPKKIKTEYSICEYDGVDFVDKDGKYLFEVHTAINSDGLNEEVEIIEEKKIPEKLELVDDENTITLFSNNAKEWTILDNVDVLVCDKINEIIDYLKSKGEER